MEIKNINLIPEGDKPIIHASQFDENRSVRFDLKDGTEEYTLLADLVVTCNIKKVDGNIVTFEVENTESTYVVITLPLQATACAGPNIGEIVITDEETSIIGTINFILEVERSPMLGGIESASDIHDLTEQIEVIVTQVIATDYYTKSEVDNLLDDKADITDLPDMSNYYDKSSVDTLLNGKANVSDLNNYYNKTQVDNLLDDKADITDLPDMSNYYTKTEVDNKFLDIMPVNTVSDSIANFTTLIVAPLEGLKTYIVAQGGGGTPSSPVAITGVSSITLTCADEAMQTVDTFTLNLGQTVYGGYVDWKMGKGYITWARYNDLATNISSIAKDSSSWRVYYSSEFYGLDNQNKEGLCDKLTFRTTYSGVNNNNYSISFPSSSGNQVLLRNDDLASSSDVETFLATLDCVYPLATSIEIDLPTTMPQTIEGVQNWFSDSGDIDISFKQDIQNYVDSKISAANANRTLSMIRPVTTEESKGDEDER